MVSLRIVIPDQADQRLRIAEIVEGPAGSQGNVVLEERVERLVTSIVVEVLHHQAQIGAAAQERQPGYARILR